MIWYIGTVTALMVIGVMMTINTAFSGVNEERKRLIYGLASAAIIAFLGTALLNMVSAINDIRERNLLEQCAKSPNAEQCIASERN